MERHRAAKERLVLVRRIVPCLDIKDGRVVKGVRFVDLSDAGDPSHSHAATRTRAPTNWSSSTSPRPSRAARRPSGWCARWRAELTIPFAVGGGVKTVEDMNDLLRAGCDKVSMNSAAVRDPELVDEAAHRFGAQCVVVAIDARRATAVSKSSSTAGARRRGAMRSPGRRSGAPRRGRTARHHDRPRRHARRFDLPLLARSAAL